jgi:hypothetical protein
MLLVRPPHEQQRHKLKLGLRSSRTIGIIMDASGSCKAQLETTYTEVVL